MSAAKTIHIYLLAGVASSASIFNVCTEKLEKLFGSQGFEPVVKAVFPYGDNSRNVVRQVLEVRSDLSNRMAAGRIGGRQAFRQIKKSYRGGRLLLIGHSGGGAAAYQAAKLLNDDVANAEDFRVVQVGAPRTPIQSRFKERVSYFHAIDGTGRMIDPITRIGTWGGWNMSKYAVPRWNSFKYAPGYIEGVKTVGGHADYFRHLPPFLDTESVCNLDKTLSSVQGWLEDWISAT